MHVLIIGQGPAGISAALYARRGGADVTVIGKDIGALQTAESVENYYGIAAPISGAALAQSGIEGARRLGVHIAADEVLDIKSGAEGFVAAGKDALYHGDAVILAAGTARKIPSIAGLDAFLGHGVSSCAICDAFFYRGKTAAVIGAGEYALHEMQALLPHAEKVLLFTNGAALHTDIPPDIPVYTARIARLEGEKRVARVVFDGGTSADVDGVFLAIGTAGTRELSNQLGVLTDAGSIVVNERMETNVAGVYAAGDCTGGLLQIVKATYEGAQAGLSALHYLRGRQSVRK